MKTIEIIATIFLLILTSLYWGRVLSVKLPRLSVIFERKPFSCRPCLTFWIHSLGASLIALFANSWLMAISGIVTAFIVFGIVWSIDRKKVIE